MAGGLAGAYADVAHGAQPVEVVDRSVAVVVLVIAGLVGGVTGAGVADQPPLLAHPRPVGQAGADPCLAGVSGALEVVHAAIAVVIDGVADLVARQHLTFARAEARAVLAAHIGARAAGADAGGALCARVALPTLARFALAATHGQVVQLAVAIVIGAVADLHTRSHLAHAGGEAPLLAGLRARPAAAHVLRLLGTLVAVPDQRLVGVVLINQSVAVLVDAVAGLDPGVAAHGVADEPAAAEVADPLPLPLARTDAVRAGCAEPLEVVDAPVAVVVEPVATFRRGLACAGAAHHGAVEQVADCVSRRRADPQAHLALDTQTWDVVHHPIAVVVYAVADLRHGVARRCAADQLSAVHVAHTQPTGRAGAHPGLALLARLHEVVHAVVAVVIDAVAGLVGRHHLTHAGAEAPAVTLALVGAGAARPHAFGAAGAGVAGAELPRLAGARTGGQVVQLAVAVVVGAVADLHARTDLAGAGTEATVPAGL